MTRKTKTKSKKSDLVKLSERDALKAFRHNIAVLKKSGLIPSSVDARKVKPTKHYKSIIKKFADVITGKVKAVKVHKACTGVSCPTVKKGKDTIALVDMSTYRNPKVISNKKGIQIIDRFFGSKTMDIVMSNRAEALLSMTDNQIALMQSNHPTTKNKSYIFTIKDKSDSGKEYMSKIRFHSLDKLLEYMSYYSLGAGNASFVNSSVTIRLMSDDDISEFQKEQRAATEKAKRERAALRRRESRARKAGNGPTRNITW